MQRHIQKECIEFNKKICDRITAAIDWVQRKEQNVKKLIYN